MSCRDYVEALIERSERFVDLNAFTQFAPENIRSAARKPMSTRRMVGFWGRCMAFPLPSRTASTLPVWRRLLQRQA